MAVDELVDASQYYESCRQGLGERFLKCVDDAVKFLEINPLLFRADELGRRKYLIKTFPFQLIYKVRENIVFILAVAHTSRNPGYWISRDK